MSILDEIVAYKRLELRDTLQVCSLEEMEARAHHAPAARDFRKALCASTIAVIAEIKRSSPSAGMIRQDFDPLAIARAYQAGGASALSVLTESRYFGGSLEILRQVRAAVSIPILRKDFTLDPYHVYEARAAGADAVLLIAAILQEPELRQLYTLSRNLGMAALVEVHTVEEMQMAARLEADLVGINNRDLKTFHTRLETTAELAAIAPPGAILAALSGISNREDVALMSRAGASAVLVGESLMRSHDLEAATRALVGIPN